MSDKPRAPRGWKSTEWNGKQLFQCQGCPRTTFDRDEVPKITSRCRKSVCPGAAHQSKTVNTGETK